MDPASFPPDTAPPLSPSFQRRTDRRNPRMKNGSPSIIIIANKTDILSGNLPFSDKALTHPKVIKLLQTSRLSIFLFPAACRLLCTRPSKVEPPSAIQFSLGSIPTAIRAVLYPSIRSALVSADRGADTSHGFSSGGKHSLYGFTAGFPSVNHHMIRLFSSKGFDTYHGTAELLKQQPVFPVGLSKDNDPVNLPGGKFRTAR